MKTHADIIEAKGGSSEFARAIGAEPAEVMVWKSRKRIPRSRWLQVHEAFPDLTSRVLTSTEQAA
jgi:hypothetical protein